MKSQPFSKNEAIALINACPNTTAGIRDKALLALLYRGGTRISATLRIRPGDIDWDRKVLVIHKDKGNKGRTIVLDEDCLNILKIWSERRKSLGVNGKHPFFCGVNKNSLGKELSSSQYRHKFKKLQEDTGIEKRCHPHCMRHTHASELVQEGFDLATISRQLGHSSASVTARYIHELCPELMNEKLSQRKWL